MEDQIPNSQVPPVSTEGRISAQDLEQMKARARELAIQQTLFQQKAVQQVAQAQQPQVVYVRRNLTVAELLLVLLLSTGIVAATQAAWSFVSNALPKIEIKIK